MRTYYPPIFENQRYPIGTLCNWCQNAVPNLRGRGCSWSRSLTPVVNWIATAVIRSQGGKQDTTYCVHECPQFQEEEPR